LHTHIHASQIDCLVAALSADPETIEELQAALRRYIHSHSRRDFFETWRPGTDDEPWDAGVCIIDLAARLVVIESTYDQPGPSGGVEIRLDDERAKVVPYHLAEDWLFVREALGWEATADARRQARLAHPPLDARPILYGKACEFIVRNCLEQASGRREKRDVYEAISNIHALWLTTPRDDLRRKAPRDVLLERHNHIVWDMQDRCEQWSILGGQPPALSRESAAYRFGGFGIHEIVLYYYLVRYLLEVCWDRLVAERDEAARPDIAAEVAWVESMRDGWLESPNYEIISGRTPESVIEKERIRVPEAMTRDEAIVDHDCPLCQMMADMPGPMFWHLDGCNMDDDFAFSFHRTRDEWEAERRKWEEFNRRWEEEHPQPILTDAKSIWRCSGSDPHALDGPPALAVFALAAHLGELTQDLKDTGASHDMIDELNRSFGNVRDVADPPNTDLLEPVIEKMCETLAAVGEAHPLLADKTADLERQFRRFASRLVEPPEFDELPF
jgi:hypothetical protein